MKPSAIVPENGGWSQRSRDSSGTGTTSRCDDSRKALLRGPCCLPDDTRALVQKRRLNDMGHNVTLPAVPFQV